MKPVTSYGLAATILTALADPGLAAPVSQNGDFVPAQVVDFNNATVVCGLTYQDKAGAWAASGAAFHLEKFLASLDSPFQWQNKMMRAAAGSAAGKKGGAGVSSVDCSTVDAVCPPAVDADCRLYKPPAAFHIHKAIVNFHAMLESFHETLQNVHGVASDGVDQIVQDFGQPKTVDFNILAAVGAIVGATALIPGAAPLVATIGSGVAAGIGFAGAFTPAPDEDTTLLALKAELAQSFLTAEASLDKMAQVVFGNGTKEDIAALPGSSAQPDLSPISRFFAGGRFLLDNASGEGVDTVMRPFKDALANLTTERMVLTALKAQNYYAWVDTNRGKEKCNGATARWLNNQCFEIHVFNDNVKDVRTDAIPEEAGKKISEKYHIDLDAFYGNADECQTRNPDFSGDVRFVPFVGAPGSVPALPACFFSLPVIKAAGSPCQFEGYLPEELVNTARCNDFSSVRPPSDGGFDRKGPSIIDV